jgi:UDP-N-acetyl-D-mannosaminuronate dehydrogenase
VIATNHPEFKNLGLERLGELVRRRVIVDGRRVVEPHRAAERGFKYYGVGYGRAFRV